MKKNVELNNQNINTQESVTYLTTNSKKKSKTPSNPKNSKKQISKTSNINLSLQEKIKNKKFNILKTYIPIESQRQILNLISKFSIFTIFNEDDQETQETNFVEVDELTLDMMYDLVVLDELTNLEILDYIHDKTEDGGIKLNISKAHEIYDLLKMNQVVEDINDKTESYLNLKCYVLNQIHATVTLKNSTSYTLDRIYNDFIFKIQNIIDKIPNQEHMMNVIQNLPNMLNNLDEDKLKLISTAVGLDLKKVK